MYYFQYGNFKYKQNEHIQQKKNKPVATTAFKITCLIDQCYQHCSGTAIFLKNVNFILSAGCNNEMKLKMTLKLSLAKYIFN